MLDASNDWAFLSLGQAAEVTVDDEWDLAFSTTSVRVNSERAASALLADQSDFFDAEDKPVTNVFTNATANSEQEHLLASYDLASVTFSTETTDAALGRDGENFYNYNFMTHVVSANDDAWWVVRSAEGDSFAKLNVVEVSFASDVLSLEAEFFVQGSGDSTYSATAVNWAADVADGELDCFDFDSGTTVDCDTSTSWDLKLKIDGRSFMLLTNGGVSGSGEAGLMDAMSETGADQEVDGNELNSRAFLQDKGSNAITTQPWYAYDLLGRHGIWPNYRVYGIENLETETVMLVQLINYYNDADAGRHITVRFRAAD
ncbi:HmuY family protein [Saccharospirillum impatiens]|uniref:HmuY family protein n=1 Tax=Saccharospirillum impatiens TaxID=169438 RepID=UPI00146D06D4|nr:HmuY family protein [Saccharospirillum impatiens]